MVSFANASLFEQDSVNKKLHIRFDSSEITNANVYAEEFELTESLCSNNSLTFGSCEASAVKFKVDNTFGSLKGKTLTITLEVDNSELPLGVFKVDSDRPDADREYRNVVAYDGMVDILNADVTSWYKGLTFPMTLQAFRNSFFSHLGVTQVSASLVNDSMTVRKTLDVQKLNGSTVINAICEINGVFGQMSRQGQFKYVSLAGFTDDDYEITSSRRISADYEDYTATAIGKVQICTEVGDVGVTVGTGSNKYVVVGNFLVIDKGTTERRTVAQNLYNKIGGITYRPCAIECQGNPCVEVGDAIKTTSRDNVLIQTYVLQRTLKGVQALFDAYTADGVEAYGNEPSSISDEIQQLNGKANVLSRTIEETRSTIYDENGQSIISQMANEIVLTVDSEGNMVKVKLHSDEEGSQFQVKATNIDLTAEEAMTLLSGGTLDLTAKEVTINSTNFSVTEDGTVTANAGDIAGWKLANNMFYKQYNGEQSNLLGYMQFFHPTMETNGDFTLKLHSPDSIDTANEYGRLIQAKIDDSAFDYIYIGYDGQAKFGEIYIRGGWDAKENEVIRYPHVHTYFKTSLTDYRPGFYIGEDGLSIQASDTNEDGTPNYGNETGSFICHFTKDYSAVGTDFHINGDLDVSERIGCKDIVAFGDIKVHMQDGRGRMKVITEDQIVITSVDVGENASLADYIKLVCVYEE